MKLKLTILLYLYLSQLLANECIQFQKQQITYNSYHQKFVDQYETEITWDVDWDNYFEGEFFYGLEMACEHAEKVGFKYQLYSPYELLIIYQYTRHLYSHVNSWLRSDKSSENINLILDALDSSIKKFPVYLGQVKRGSYQPKEVDVFYYINNTVFDKAYLSTSKISAKPYTNYHERPYQFVINVCHGYDISAFSAHPDEEEVLIPRMQKFKILNRFEQEKQIFLTLHELTNQNELCSNQ